MIVGNRQKMLSPSEMKQFLSKLDELGFFTLESNGRHDQEDKLYNFGDQYEESFDGLYYCISVNAEKSGSLCAYEPSMQFLIPQMKNILKYYDEYKPTGLTPYYPDRILISIEPVNEDHPDFSKNATPWDKRFPSLTFSPTRKYTNDIPAVIMYVQGDMAKKIALFMDNSQTGDLFIENGKKYIVQVDVIYPDEQVKNDYQ